MKELAPNRFLEGIARWAVAVLLCWGAPGGFAADNPAAAELTATEYDIKAAYLYNLAKFVGWPPEKSGRDDAPWVIGITGQEAFEHASDVIRKKTIGKHPVVVRLLSSEQEIADCHILFLTRSQKQGMAGMLGAANKAAVLTVGETDSFLDSGGMISFVISDDRIRFEVNLTAVRAAKLKLGGRLLGLARAVRGKPGDTTN
jgi:hypothetical protein